MMGANVFLVFNNSFSSLLVCIVCITIMLSQMSVEQTAVITIMTTENIAVEHNPIKKEGASVGTVHFCHIFILITFLHILTVVQLEFALFHSTLGVQEYYKYF